MLHPLMLHPLMLLLFFHLGFELFKCVFERAAALRFPDGVMIKCIRNSAFANRRGGDLARSAG
jgi:hypothetical protein